MHEEAEERARAEAAASERDRLLGEVHDSLAPRLVSVREHVDSAQRDRLDSESDGLLGAPAEIAIRTF
jgi:signal transduction histidine kinase